jgi:CRP/FNR family cyclic AMP-dependent transcriptional regulator
MAVQSKTLSQLPFFAALDGEALREVAGYVHEVSVSAGQVVVLEGEPCQAVYFPVRGLLRTRRLSADGREQVLSYIGLGGSFNLVAALDGGDNVATMDALSGATVYVIPCRDFQHIVAEHQEVALAVSRYLAGEVRHLSDMVESLALHTVRSRLAGFLLDRAAGRAPPRRWTQEEIASQIGTVREMVGRTLRAFADEGWIRRERGRIVVVDRQGLEREAAGRDR